MQTVTQKSCVIFDSEHIQALFQDGQGDTLLVTFNGLGGRANGRDFWGQKFAAKSGLPVLGLVGHASNWFPADAMAHARAAAAPILKRFPRRILYGSSMGGFAALKYNRLFDATASVAFSPQYSIAPADIGHFERRFQSFYTPGLHDGMAIHADDISGHAWLLGDPHFPVDREHYKCIRAAVPKVEFLSLPMTGHETVRVFASTAAASALLRAAAEGDAAAMIALIRQRRRASAQRAYGVIEAALQRHPERALALYPRYDAVMTPNQRASWLTQAGVMQYKKGELASARDLLEQASVIRPKDDNLVIRIIDIYLREGDVAAALDRAQALIEAVPTKALAHGYWALAALQLGLPQAQAEAALDTAARLAGNDGSILGSLAERLLAIDAVQPALAMARRASELQPNELRWPILLATAAARADRMAAIPHFKAAVAIAPHRADLRARLADLLLAQCDQTMKEALREIDEACRLAPHDLRYSARRMQFALRGAGGAGRSGAPAF